MSGYARLCPVVSGCVPCPEEGGHASIHRIEGLKTRTRNKGKVRVFATFLQSVIRKV